ncbi:MAG: SdpI family protein [Ruminococcus sp.]|uniref:SdpI family protein n=1 Tax=Ruminococcus sp. TaxID=41978 RepID=UPI0025D205F7|nr:SdpI family protein [Ruminococcus sp.]MCR5601656.1 SdpI family protein [Ruminococcus sp.]
MKNLQNAKTFNIASLAVSFVNIAAAVFAVSRLPEKVPTHFDFNGVCNSFGSRWGLMFIAFIPLLLNFIFMLTARLINAKQPKLIALTSFVISVFFAAEFWLIYMVSSSGVQLGDKLERQPAITILPMMMSALFIVLGNYTPIIAPNKFLGLRVKWTLQNPQCWKITHRFMGKVMVVTGLITALLSVISYAFTEAGFATEFILTFVMIAVSIFIPTIFAYNHRNDN